VIVKETGAGVGGLVVVAHDPKERIGSAITDAQGSFSIAYGAGPDGRSWSVTLEVLAQDVGGARVLYKDAAPRHQAGIVESYSIRLPHELLSDAQVHLSEDAIPPAFARAVRHVHLAKEGDRGAEVLAKEISSRIESSRARRQAIEARVVEELLARDRRPPPRRYGVQQRHQDPHVPV